MKTLPWWVFAAVALWWLGRRAPVSAPAPAPVHIDPAWLTQLNADQEKPDLTGYTELRY